MSLPSSSVLVAADSMMNSSSRPVCSTRCFMTNSAIGERQIFPWQTKRIRFIFINLLIIYIEYIKINFFCRLHQAIKQENHMEQEELLSSLGKSGAAYEFLGHRQHKASQVL